MKRQLILIGQLSALVVLSMLFAGNMGWVRRASGQDAVPTSPPPAREVSLSTYAFLPGETRADVALWSNEGVVSVGDSAVLYAEVKDGFGTVVYVNRQALSSLDETWLRSKYKTGVAFSGVGIPLSELGAKLEVVPEVPDLDMAYAHERIQVSLCFEHSNGLSRRKLFYTDFWQDLTSLPVVLERSLAPADN